MSMVAPIRIGVEQAQILEAMAMAKPIVSTTLWAEGIAAADQRELLLADTAGAFGLKSIGSERRRPRREPRPAARRLVRRAMTGAPPRGTLKRCMVRAYRPSGPGWIRARSPANIG